MTSNKTLIISRNDLEAKTICDLATDLGFDIVPLRESWGARPDPGDPALDPDRLGRLVVLVECPEPAFEDMLRRIGHVVELVDHHLYVQASGEKLDRRRARSSLEQFVAQFGRGELTEKQRLIAANDRGFWPALLDEAVRSGRVDAKDKTEATRERLLSKVRKVREEDLALRPHTVSLDCTLKWLLSKLGNRTKQATLLGCGRENPNDPELLLVRAPIQHRYTMADAIYELYFSGRIQRPGCWFGHTYQRPIGELLARPLEFLIAYEDNGRIVQVEYSGPGERLALLDQLTDEILQERGRLARLRIWVGGARRACFFGAEQGEASAEALGELADQLADLLLSGNRPLLRWRTQFHQVLRYKGGDPHVPETSQGLCQTDPCGDAERSYFVDYLRGFLVPEKKDLDCEIKNGRLRHNSLMFRSFSVLGGPGADAATGHAQRLPRLRMTVDVLQRKRQIECALAAIKVHFLFGRIIVIEWVMQGEVPGYDNRPTKRDDLFCWLLAHNAGLAAGGLVFVPKDDKDEASFPNVPWRTLASPDVDCVARLLDVNNVARNCYASYYSKRTQHDITLIDPDGRQLGSTCVGARAQPNPDVPTGWFAPLVDFALRPFGLDRGRVHLVLDERARIVCAATLVGSRPDLPAAEVEQQVLFARLATVDEFEPRHFYDAGFVAGELERTSYRRFATSDSFPGTQNLFAVTDQSFVLFGFGWFAANVAIHHVACHYNRIFLVGLLYTAILHRFGEELASLPDRSVPLADGIALLRAKIDSERKAHRVAWKERRELVNKLRELTDLAREVRRVREDFLTFSGALWFDEICTQVQGRELYALMMQQLPARADYREITAEIERADDLETQKAAVRSEAARAEIAVVAGLAGAFLFVAQVFPWGWKDLLAPWWTWPIRFALSGVVIAAVPIATLSAAAQMDPRDASVEVVWLLGDAARAGWRGLKSLICWACRDKENP